MRLLLLFFLLFSATLYGQSPLNITLDGSEKGKKLSELLKTIEEKQAVRFYFMEEWIDDVVFEETYEGKTLSQALYELFVGTDLTVVEINPNTIILVKDPTQSLQRNLIIGAAKREQKKIDKLIIGAASGKIKKESIVHLTGKIVESDLKSPLTGVSVYVSTLQTGTVTNAEGRFDLKLPSGQHIISFTFVNFEEKVIDLEIYQNGNLNLELEEVPTVLDEVVVEDKAGKEILTKTLGLTQLNIAAIKKSPAMLGEVDLIKQIQTLPGVTTVGEAASGFNVRGGSVDQNLILYDGLPVFNSSHVFGFFSSFNADAIRDANFYKGGIPAEFGGRTSSVLDIRSREGSYDKWQGSGGIGVVSSNLMANGPLVKGKTSLAVSVRSTYSDWVINTIRSNYVDLNKSRVAFYDGSAKVTHAFNQNTKLTLSGYLSHDQFRLRGDSTYRWDTKLSSLRFDHAFSKSLNFSVMTGYGEYTYDVFDKDPVQGFDLSYSMRYPTAQAEFHVDKEKHKLIFGMQSIYYDFRPGTLKPASDLSDKRFIEMDKQQSLESGLFLADKFRITGKLHADVGLRFSFFNALGPGDVFLYKSGQLREPLSRIDTIQYSKGQSIKKFNNWEPRIDLRYEINEQSSLKIGFNRMFQYLHLVTNTTAITPIDIWQPSGFYFKPQMADQLSAGYTRKLKNKPYDFSLEVYYKKSKNVLDFKDGAVLLLNNQIETDLLQGKGRAYGAEMQMNKNTGRLTGSVSYSYSRSFRTIIGVFPEENINNGKEYRSNFDQPHVINIQWKYNISRRYFFTGGFTYHTGRPITLPVSAFSVGSYTVSAFSDRNQFRIPDYHRLDVAIVMEGNHKRRKLLDGTWTFSLYNVYGRKNPYSVFFKEARPGILRPYRLAIIGTVLPSLSVGFKI